MFQPQGTFHWARYQVNISTALSNVVWQMRFSRALRRLWPCSGWGVHLLWPSVGWNPKLSHIWKEDRHKVISSDPGFEIKHVVFKYPQIQFPNSPAPPVCALVCGGFTFPKNTNCCQIRFFIIIHIVTLAGPCDMAPSPPPSFWFQLIVQDIGVFWFLSCLLKEEHPVHENTTTYDR